jgi:hypothetical protein
MQLDIKPGLLPPALHLRAAHHPCAQQDWPLQAPRRSGPGLREGRGCLRLQGGGGAAADELLAMLLELMGSEWWLMPVVYFVFHAALTASPEEASDRHGRPGIRAAGPEGQMARPSVQDAARELCDIAGIIFLSVIGALVMQVRRERNRAYASSRAHTVTVLSHRVCCTVCGLRCFTRTPARITPLLPPPLPSHRVP